MKHTKMLVSLLFLCLACTSPAFAGTDATLAAINTWLRGMMEGSYGLLGAFASLAVGIPVGIVTRSLMWIASSVGIAATAYYGPGILAGIVTATLPF